MSNVNDTTATETLEQTIARLQAENAALKAKAAPKTSLKVSEKGAISLYGLGRWPVTLYRTQWEALFAKVDAIKAFIAENEDRLAKKPE